MDISDQRKSAELINSAPGLGFQAVIDQGQDVTQCGANGNTYMPIARGGGVDAGADLAYKLYYAYEDSSGYPDGSSSFYKIVGFFPDFWDEPPANSSLLQCRSFLRL